MTTTRIGRHLAAVVAPFKPDLSLDESALRRVCRHVLELEGIDGLVVNAQQIILTIDPRTGECNPAASLPVIPDFHFLIRVCIKPRNQHLLQETVIDIQGEACRQLHCPMCQCSD